MGCGGRKLLNGITRGLTRAEDEFRVQCSLSLVRTTLGTGLIGRDRSEVVAFVRQRGDDFCRASAKCLAAELHSGRTGAA